ncbi:universal stress protein [Metaclostridioides mangenotii]|uniref:Nucleotide-binding universal stress UspA family protein n=1 Tax=Metaclostridioides mangenotii TaxID=1540 RepID=A0ABS4ED72_9FIRM|nr:universal stress protein [Clostridioides mangenotii]MBP1855864.1 nucleotide-binding universal stress UspA family protein [Clostridioides mangenotii]
MNKKNVLVPIDGTERSMHSLEFIKGIFDKDEVIIEIMNVKELVFIDGISLAEEIKNSEALGRRILDRAVDIMGDYEVKIHFTFGYPGEEIIRKAKEDNSDYIVMTKSTKKGLTRMIGSVTASVVKQANCIVMIVPE